MLLVIDAGNSRLKWGLWDGKHLAHVQAFDYARTDFTKIAFSLASLPVAPSEVMASNVAGEKIAQPLHKAVTTALGLRARFVRVESDFDGLTVAYEQPGRLGADRWLAMLAARQMSKTNLCVVDAGTAMTIDAVSRDGRHLGGCIVPGIELMQDSLFSATTGIGEASGDAGDSIFATDTATAVRAGAANALGALVERSATELRADTHGAVTIFLTGGQAEIVAGHVRRKTRQVPDLVLRGLVRVAEVQATSQVSN